MITLYNLKSHFLWYFVLTAPLIFFVFIFVSMVTYTYIYKIIMFCFYLPDNMHNLFINFDP